MSYQPIHNNVAYIDVANLHQATIRLGWRIDYRKFRVWLSDKYQVSHAYVFCGYLASQKGLYKRLKSCGYIMVFREVIVTSKGQVKGNCDADLIVEAMRDFYEKDFSQAILVTSDGDYLRLVKFFQEKAYFRVLLSPAPANRCSLLLRRAQVPITYLPDQRQRLQLVP